MLDIQSVINKNLELSIQAKREFIENKSSQDKLVSAIELVSDCYKSGGRLLIAGNGGSAADSQHLAAEFVSKLARDRAPLPAEALTTDSSILTAIGNDYGYEKVFSRQIAGKAKPGDVFLGITTSGNSKNIIEALKACKELGISSVVFSGKGGGVVADYADICVVASGTYTSQIQELHIVMAHTLCECVENEMFGVQ